MPSSIDSEDSIRDNDVCTERRCSNLYSEAELFRVLLDYIAEILPKFGLREDHYFEDARLFLYTVACTTAAYSSYYYTLESHRLQVALGVAAFFGLLSLGFLLEILGNRNSMMTMSDSQGMRYYIYGDLDRRSNDIQFTLSRRKPILTGLLAKPRPVIQLVDEKSISVTRYVGKYFFQSGRLNCQEVMESFENLTDALGLPIVETAQQPTTEKIQQAKMRNRQPRATNSKVTNRAS